MQIELLAIPTGGVRYYGIRNPNPATPRVEAECSKNLDPGTPGSEEPGNAETHVRKETK